MKGRWRNLLVRQRQFVIGAGQGAQWRSSHDDRLLWTNRIPCDGAAQVQQGVELGQAALGEGTAAASREDPHQGDAFQAE